MATDPHSDTSTAILATITPWLHEAGELLTAKPKELKIDVKNHDELVTATDLAVDRLLSGKIAAAYPEHRILSEESQTSLPDYGGYVWVLDPIDGTVNYACGVPFSAISIALCRDGEAVLGAVYNPHLGHLYAATKGGGATLNGAAIGKDHPRRAGYTSPVVATGFPYDSDKRDLARRQLDRLLDEFGYVRRLGSAALDLCLVADGTFAGYYEIDLSPWDIAAGALIVREAGHQVGNLVAAPGNLPEELNGKHLVAGHAEAYATMRAILKLD